MASVLKISEATSLAFHAMGILAQNPKKMFSTKEIASFINASEAHLAKVLQRLAKAGLIESVRGPKGGFTVRDGAANTSLLEIYETIDGPLDQNNCLLGPPICQGKGCILGGLLSSVNQEVKRYLSETRLSDLEKVFEIGGEEKCLKAAK